MNKTLLFSAWLVGACGGNSGSTTPDQPPPPAMITISGTAKSLNANGSTPESGVTVEAFANSADTTVVATAMTDASGNYSLMITTDGKALDGFLKATKGGLLDTYLYPPEPLNADFSAASINMISSATFNLVELLCGANQDAAKGTIAMIVQDAADMPLAGATVASNPAASSSCYNDPSSGRPSSSATGTAPDGIGYLFSVVGNTMVSATASGQTIRSHAVNARAGALTTTLVQP